MTSKPVDVTNRDQLVYVNGDGHLPAVEALSNINDYQTSEFFIHFPVEFSITS